MFVGENSISKVVSFLSGADLVLTFKSFYEDEKANMPENVAESFHKWVCEKSGVESFHAISEFLIEKYNSEEIALEELINLYKDYRGSKFGRIFNVK